MTPRNSYFCPPLIYLKGVKWALKQEVMWAFKKHCEKKEKHAGNSIYTTGFFFIILTILELSTENGSNLDKAKDKFCRLVQSHCKFQHFFSVILTFFQTINFRFFPTGKFAGNNFEFKKRFKLLQIGRKHCWKRRNCSLWAISPFPTVFSKDSYCRQVKTRACLGKG